MLEAGDKIGGYTVTRELGRGGMGVVYLAHDPALKRDASIKLMLPGQAAGHGRRRFSREAAAIAKCGHPGIIKVYSYGEHEGLPYLAMEFVDGKTLGEFLELSRTVKNAGDLEVLKKYGYLQEPSPEDEELPYFLRPLTASPLTDGDYESHAAALVAGVADALFEAHSQGILHRDIKPSNILIGRKGPPKLADFGLAKLADSTDITTGQPMIGTLKYMAPEVFSGGEASEASDIYSLGTVLYELLTLSHPFNGDSPAALIKSVTQDACKLPSVLNPDISPALNLVVMKCLEKSPGARYKNARELADAIRLAARPKGLKTQIVAGLRDLLKPAEAVSVEPAASEEKPARITPESRAAAAALVKESQRAYLTDFATPKAHNLVLEALKLDPYSTDANGMLVLLSYHMGLHAAVKKAIPRLRRLAKSGPDADTRRRAALLADRAETQKDWLRNMERYLAEGHDDPAMLALCARGQLNGTDTVKARQYVKRIEKSFPGPLLFTWFIEAYHHAWTGEAEKYLQITRDAIKRFPANPMVRYALAQHLMEAGSLDEAGRTMDEADALGMHEDFFYYLRGELAALRGDLKGACAEFRKFIGAGPGDMLAYAYYRLSKLYTRRGDKKEALRHLEIGRNLAPELNLKSNEELAALIEGSADYRPAFEDLPQVCLEFNHLKSRETLLKNLFADNNNAGEAHSTVYILERGAPPRAVRNWCYFNQYYLGEAKRTKTYFQAQPMSSFVDSRGNVLKAEFIRTCSEYGRYLATVNYAVPLKHLALGPIEAQLNPEGLFKERHDGQTELRVDEINSRLGYRCHILAVQEDAELLHLSAKPDEELKRGGWRFLVWSRFFFDRERFRLNARVGYKRA